MSDTEIDQSVHIEDVRADTVLALSNDLQYAIRIPAATKRAAARALREKSKHPLSQKRIALRMFAAAVYLLLCNRIAKIKYVVIDAEYLGHEGEIKGMILAYWHREGVRVSSRQITFGHIGKKSRAHDLAIRTWRGEFKENKRITEMEFLAVLQ
ncbi:MAG: hypothetical protein HY868_07520 [Chloroflexi bacterium]|nr:hypothetical protein [Chloroflexota bacterium]